MTQFDVVRELRGTTVRKGNKRHEGDNDGVCEAKTKFANPISYIISDKKTKTKKKEGVEQGRKNTYQFRVSGLTVLRLFLCFHHVRQLAFSRRTPLAISFFCFVMLRHDLQTSSSSQLWER